MSSSAWQFTRLVDEHVLAERSVTGKTPGAVIRAAPALEAKRLLARTELSAARVAQRPAFEDASGFGRFVKRETGGSPGDSRREVREKYQFTRER
ncbi:helix-turn-helix domain-containing protein [Actinosynnema sp. NPDC023587]|uniref:helix-turn-helix domain-containing protein n=1 Tax=Actinosynnema sp. NPDC023587 TaxID=3154695 RepID=UPI003409EB93